MTTYKVLAAALIAALLFFIGRQSVDWNAEPAPGASAEHAQHEAAAMDAPAATLWTCPMHPQIKLPDPGDCPICGMDLVPMTKGSDDDPRQFAMSPAAKLLAEVEVDIVRRKNVTKPVRMVGKIDYDETAVKTISAYVAGRIERLFVDYTGVRVNRGEHLVSLYSPELLNAQEELLSARDLIAATEGEASAFLAASSEQAYTSARDKLLLWGLTEAQVAAIEARGTAEDHVMLTSPTSGVVIDKRVDEGAYVMMGTPIYRIADLSRLWVRLDAYEQDLAWLRFGQAVTFEVEALPGRELHGTVAYIDPILNDRTRTAKVRVNVDNAEGLLKPGMFVRAYAASRLGAGGAVLEDALVGKWICPMHPEIVKDGPAECDICGMDVVPAEELGLVGSHPESTARPLVVPASAVLATGKRAVVYVEVPGAERPTYEGREVALGPRAGDEYVIMAGLAEGERVVVNGAFRIDSSMQILAKPSMMSMEGDDERLEGPAASVFRESLRPVYAHYFALQEALAGDDVVAARAAADALAQALENPSAAGLPSAHRTIWREELGRMRAALAGITSNAEVEIAQVRTAFEPIAAALLLVAGEFGHVGAETLSAAYCPMAFDNRGAAWLQRGDELANPYFGASMLRCGEIQSRIPGSPGPGAVQPPAPMGPEPATQDASIDSPATPAEGDAPIDQAADDADLKANAAVLAPVFAAYLDAHEQLAADAAMPARMALGKLLPAVASAAERAGGTPAAKPLHAMHSALLQAKGALDVESLRILFRDLSVELIALHELVGNPVAEPLYVAHCPMAFDNAGADWVQRGEAVLNPYFGATMLGCGELRGTWAPAQAVPTADPLAQVFEAYLQVQVHLAADDAGAARRAFGELLEAVDASLEEVSATNQAATAHASLQAMQAELRAAEAAGAPDLDGLRTLFETVSTELITIEQALGNPTDTPLAIVHCPMAFEDAGADWIQVGDVVANPYFGAAMLRCGVVTRTSEND